MATILKYYRGELPLHLQCPLARMLRYWTEISGFPFCRHQYGSGGDSIDAPGLDHFANPTILSGEGEADWVVTRIWAFGSLSSSARFLFQKFALVGDVREKI